MLKRILIALGIMTVILAGFVWYHEDFQTFFYASFMTLLMFLKNLVLRGLWLFKSFIFKGGIVSISNVAWKKVMVTSTIALFKRAWINTLTAFFNQRVKQPLFVPISRYLKYQWLYFKHCNIWKKLFYSVIGLIPTSVILYLSGVWNTLSFFLSKISVAKFLTFILNILTVIFSFFTSFWNNWIQPYIDFIIITVIFGFIEKIPVIGYLFRFIRIMTKRYTRRFHRKKEVMIDQHVDHRVNKIAEHIHQYADERKQALSELADDKEQILEEEAHKLNKNKH